MNNIGASATSRAAPSYSAAYSYLGHRWMTTFRSANKDIARDDLRLLTRMRRELKVRLRGRHYRNINVKEDRTSTL